MIDFKLSSGVNISVKQISNHIIFHEVSKSNIVLPLPPLFELDDGRTIEHTQHPLYQEALVVYQLQSSEAAFDAVLKHAVTFDTKLLRHNNIWPRAEKNLRFVGQIKGDNEKVNFLKFLALAESSIEEKNKIVRSAVLTENDVAEYFLSIQIGRDGINILQANIRNSIDVNISYDTIVIDGIQLVNPLDEIRACKENNIDFLKWIRCEYTLSEKAAIIGLHRLNQRVKSHEEDAIQIESERKSKSKGKT